MGKKIAILGGGDILDYNTISNLIENYTVICADSGYHHLKKLQREASLLVGDMDSITKIPASVPLLELPSDKNYTDSAYAFQQAVARGATDIVFSGMLGGRFDHSLANLALLVQAKKQGITAIITDGITTITPVLSKDSHPISVTFPPLENHYFSLLAYSEVCHNVTILGGKYPLNHYDLRNDSARAISNEFIGVPVTITMESGLLLFITTLVDK